MCGKGPSGHLLVGAGDGKFPSDHLELVALAQASREMDSSAVIGVLQCNHELCGGAARKNLDRKFRCLYQTSFGPQGVATLNFDGGPSGRLPVGAGGGEGLSNRLTAGVGSGGVLPSLWDQVRI